MDIFQQAVTAHQAGDLVKAERLYSKYLKRNNDPAAKQLLGVLYSSQGKYEKAARLMESSLRMAPKQPEVHNNLANCYRRQGNPERAVEHYRQAIELAPQYLDAHRNLAIVLLDMQDLNAAREVIEKAGDFAPRDAGLHHLSGLIKREQGDYPGAIEAYQTALRLNPSDDATRHNLGVALRLSNQPARALECHQGLLDKGMSNFELLHNVANAHADLGQLDQAIDYYRKVLGLNPDYVDAHRNLAGLLWTMGDQDGFLESFERHFAQRTPAPEMLLAYVEILLSVGRAEQAIQFLSRHELTESRDPRFCDFLGRAHFELVNLAESQRYQTLACELAPDEIAYKLALAITLLVANRIDQAATLLEQIISVEPANQSALAHLDLACRMLGKPRIAGYNDYFAYVRAYDLPVPAGCTDITEFNRKLNDFLTSVHTSKHHPFHQTLRGGTQTQGNLFGLDSPEISQLVAGLRSCIGQYIEALSALDNPLDGFENTRRFDFSASWSVRLKSEGFHTMHIHPMSRISSVYYVEVPDTITQQDMAGWLKFGEPNLVLPFELSAEHVVMPKAGKLILFPSYMWHGTIPFESVQSRTTVAFDVVPVP